MVDTDLLTGAYRLKPFRSAFRGKRQFNIVLCPNEKARARISHRVYPCRRACIEAEGSFSSLYLQSSMRVLPPISTIFRRSPKSVTNHVVWPPPPVTIIFTEDSWNGFIFCPEGC